MFFVCVIIGCALRTPRRLAPDDGDANIGHRFDSTRNPRWNRSIAPWPWNTRRRRRGNESRRMDGAVVKRDCGGSERL